MNSIVNKLVYLIVEKLLKGKFSILMDSPLIKPNVTLLSLYNHIYNLYLTVYKEKGLVGIYKLRKQIINQISTIQLPAPSKKSKNKEGGIITEGMLKRSYTDLIVFKDILTKIRFSLELFTLVRTVITVLANAVFIPIYALSVYYLIRKIILGFSFIFTSSISTYYLSPNISVLNSLSGLKESVRIISIKIYNFIFSQSVPIDPVYEGMIVVRIEDMYPPAASTPGFGYYPDPNVGAGDGVKQEVVESYYSLPGFTNYLQEYISTCNYSLESHPYLYAGLASVFAIGTLSLLYTYPSAIPDAGGYI